jgi:assimilatory nitrate reductase catalytic subunit
MIMHARGIEHHTNGVNNVLSYINLVLATGKIGDPGAVTERLPDKATGRAGASTGKKPTNCPVSVR